MNFYVADVDNTAERAAESQLRRFGSFCNQLKGELDILGQSLIDQQSTICIKDFVLTETFDPSDNSAIEIEENLGDAALHKLLLTVSTLCAEIDDLKRFAESQIYPFLSVYGLQSDESADGIPDATAAQNISFCLPSLQHALSLIDRCNEVLENVFCQLSAFHSDEPRSVGAPKHLHLTVLFEHLCLLLSICITLDTLVDANYKLKSDFESYLRTISMAKLQLADLVDKTTEVNQLEVVCRRMKFELIGATSFQNCIERLLDQPRGSSLLLCQEFAVQIKTLASKVEFNLGKASQKFWCQDVLLGLVGLVVLQAVALDEDGCYKSLKIVQDVNKKMPVVLIRGEIEWDSLNFFNKTMQSLRCKELCRKLPTNLNTEREIFVQQIIIKAFNEKADTSLTVAGWCYALNGLKSLNQTNLHEELDRRQDLLFRGLKLALDLWYTARVISYYKLSLNDESNVSKLYSREYAQYMEMVFHLIGLLKIMKASYCRHSIALNDTILQLQQRTSAVLLQKVFRLKEKCSGISSDSSGSKVNALKILTISEQIACRNLTIRRFSALKLCVDLLAATRSFKSDELSDLLSSIDRIHALSDWNKHLRRSFNCDFLLFYPHLNQFFFNALSAHQGHSEGIATRFDAWNDAILLAQHASAPQSRDFDARLIDACKQECVEKLCEKVENDLRLSYHTHLKLDQRNPFYQLNSANERPASGSSPASSFSPFVKRTFSADAVRLGSIFIDLKRHAERYLEKNFYNLTTVALHDWKTYAEMRQLASSKYGLSLVDARLPSQTLEQGQDLLHIMRNIDQFLANYAYNLNDQVFVEIVSANKHLNTLHIRHVANSIRAHGIGVMNTAVNYTYQFLRNKFRTFSQFLYDDRVKSRLTKEARHFRDNKDSNGGIFSFDRAEKLAKSIRKLGATAAGLNYLDEFRRLITHIGNVLGLVRLVRSGGLRWCAESCQFFISANCCLEETAVGLASFYDDAESGGVQLGSKVAAVAFDRLVEQLSASFASGNEYFKLLVDVFAAEFSNTKHAHLRNFAYIIPTLTISHVESMVGRKERLQKKHQEDVAISDDGFAMGLAYTLKVLDQYNDYDSLHWIKSAISKYNADKVAANKTLRSATTSDEKLIQTVNLTAKRIERFKREFELLYFAVQSARVFFRTDPSREIIPGEQLGAEKSSSEKSLVSVG